MQKIILKTGIFIILAMLVMPIVPVFAEEIPDYAVLAPLPGVGDSGGGTTTLQKYIPAIFKLAIGLSVVAAVLLIVIGGIQYITTDAIQGKSQGKERIKNAIIGLVFIIAAWLILATINPNLLTLNLDISSAPTSAPPGGTLTEGEMMSASEIFESNTIRDSLANKGVNTYADPCVSGGTVGCVNLNGLAGTTQLGLGDLATQSNLPLRITGGTEGGHSETGGHPTGNSVDFSFRQNPNLSSFVESNGGTPTQTNDGPLYTIKIGDQNATFLKEADHWHVTFP